MPAFEPDWRRFYPDTNPIGWMMRDDSTSGWIRFHSLPLSKQYADTEEERQILLDRQNVLANEVLGEGSPCWLTRAFPELPPGSIDDGGPLYPLTAWPKYKLGLSYRFNIDDCDEPDGQNWDVYASLETWAAGAFDDLLWAIASEHINRTVWMSPATGAVFAPYDGGVDVFIPDAQLGAELRLRHTDWLPVEGSRSRSRL